LETSMRNVVQESSARIIAADTCKEIQDLLDEGCDLDEALDALEERWPRRWSPITLATVSAMRGHVVVDHVVGICDLVEVNVRHMLGELEAHSREWEEGDAEREAAWAAKRAASPNRLEMTTGEIPQSARAAGGAR
jgi:hypothetical protein